MEDAPSEEAIVGSGKQLVEDSWTPSLQHRHARSEVSYAIVVEYLCRVAGAHLQMLTY